jgi:hypothetical protein
MHDLVAYSISFPKTLYPPEGPSCAGFGQSLALISLSILVLDIVIHHIRYQEVFIFAE